MKHVLLVDDDQSVLQFMGRALGSDYHLTVARDGFEAWAAAERMIHIDLIITDYFMPSMFGDELIARARERQPGVQTLMVTGHCDELDREAPPWWQGQPHLDKPVRLDALRERVTAMIGEAQHAN